MSSNKPGNSFLRKASYVFPVKLLSNTKGPINLLPPHHTFTENLLWKMVTRVSCGFSWDHVCTFRELFILSRVKDASSGNKMTLNSSGCAVIQWHKSKRWAWAYIPSPSCLPVVLVLKAQHWVPGRLNTADLPHTHIWKLWSVCSVTSQHTNKQLLKIFSYVLTWNFCTATNADLPWTL